MGAIRPLLEQGDHFIYAGLLGQPMDRDFVRHVTVVGISVDGKLQYRLEIRTEAGEYATGYNQASLGSVDYDLALLLVEHGVWLEPEDYTRNAQLGRLNFTE